MTQISNNKVMVKLIFDFSVVKYYVVNQKNDIPAWKKFSLLLAKYLKYVSRQVNIISCHR